MSRKLAVFDIDGTLVDSRQVIHATMVEAFARLGETAPPYDVCRQVVGLNLAEALDQLAPGFGPEARAQLTANYRAVFQEMHARRGYIEPLYDGAGALVDRLRAEGWLVALATGKSRRGLELITRMHGWEEVFHSRHCAEDGAGKPDPAMLNAAMRALDCAPAQTVMIGDTVHDMRMARNAGVYAQGVSWGFQTAEEVAEGGADHVAHTFAELGREIDRFGASVS
jgi:phosphoglycolate phosphatase